MGLLRWLFGRQTTEPQVAFRVRSAESKNGAIGIPGAAEEGRRLAKAAREARFAAGRGIHGNPWSESVPPARPRR